MDLFQRRTDPERVNAELLDVIQFAGQALQVAAVEGANFLHAVFVAAIAIVVGRVAVDKAIGQHEIDGGVMPVERRGGFRFRAFKQQQTIAVKRRLEGNFTAADGRDITAIEIANFTAFGEGFADVNGKRLAIPFRTLLHLRRGGGGLFLLQRDHHGWRT